MNLMRSFTSYIASFFKKGKVIEEVEKKEENLI